MVHRTTVAPQQPSVITDPGSPRHNAVSDLMAEADSYHRFWIQERSSRIILEGALKWIINNKGAHPENIDSVARTAIRSATDGQP